MLVETEYEIRFRVKKETDFIDRQLYYIIEKIKSCFKGSVRLVSSTLDNQLLENEEVKLRVASIYRESDLFEESILLEQLFLRDKLFREYFENYKLEKIAVTEYEENRWE